MDFVQFCKWLRKQHEDGQHKEFRAKQELQRRRNDMEKSRCSICDLTGQHMHNCPYAK